MRRVFNDNGRAAVVRACRRAGIVLAGVAPVPDAADMDEDGDDTFRDEDLKEAGLAAEEAVAKAAEGADKESVKMHAFAIKLHSIKRTRNFNLKAAKRMALRNKEGG